MSNLSYFIFILIAVFVGVVVVKKIASCLIRSVILLLIIAALVYVYLNYYAA
ncbi:hypothetical protein [Prevotella sp. kh1p2]|uniref:hypothetical protein n=1 Tax=Prevotella sp. kh1p2 TaxID=1761883 RepID=UPI0008AB8FB6|nr:hypothetical protein [Prevotella sp. kh1p2]SET07881.1 hypothetical protein SAMN04487825_11367 [Prevotella sp. kh1p2]SNU10945.1 hypothetical protein SAMN06298210_10666 [Prevotellaceae bacterium KH2P17]